MNYPIILLTLHQSFWLLLFLGPFFHMTLAMFLLCAVKSFLTYGDPMNSLSPEGSVINSPAQLLQIQVCGFLYSVRTCPKVKAILYPHHYKDFNWWEHKEGYHPEFHF